jgi:hypothetical protein
MRYGYIKTNPSLYVLEPCCGGKAKEARHVTSQGHMEPDGQALLP